MRCAVAESFISSGGRNSSRSTIPNIAAFAPMPKARVVTTAIVKPGFMRRPRMAYWMSCRRLSKVMLLRHHPRDNRCRRALARGQYQTRPFSLLHQPFLPRLPQMRRLVAVPALFVLTAAAFSVTRAQANDPNMARALRVLRTAPVMDGHNDLPWRIREDTVHPMDVEAYDLRKK